MGCGRESAARRQAAAEGGWPAVSCRAWRRFEQPPHCREVRYEKEGRCVELHRDGRESRVAACLWPDGIPGAAKEHAHGRRFRRESAPEGDQRPVSYTHLTLPTSDLV